MEKYKESLFKLKNKHSYWLYDKSNRGKEEKKILKTAKQINTNLIKSFGRKKYIYCRPVLNSYGRVNENWLSIHLSPEAFYD